MSSVLHMGTRSSALLASHEALLVPAGRLSTVSSAPSSCRGMSLETDRQSPSASS
eukprot:CAMPEP_0179189008 /NCGR_PEP_ID=MMETSP0796-20121207/93819_1 /TAXON_ID=73915 /ORGANISM="Pyrodinium bahamense, Strain pbaha01" /LENGTH=54 /DNA_ID=CAMNT_0020893127 /DNA_START=61 /DNA_END=221 /DNA_ORIENTATION=-